MIRISQTLTEHDYESAAGLHYFTYRSSRVRPWLAAILIAMGSFMILTSAEITFGILFVLYGVFMLFRKKIWTRRIVKSAATAKRFGEPIQVEIDEKGTVNLVQGKERSTILLENLYGYVRDPIGYLLYSQRNLFFFLKSDAFETAEQLGRLEEILKGSGVQSLKI